MWQKTLVIIFLFYFFALLQNSFFTHFNLFGVIPNLVFIIFFLLVFFERKDNNYQIIFLAITAGIFLDIFSFTYIGPSIISLIIIGILLKNAQSLLKNKRDIYPFIYFLPLFIIFLLIYNLLSDLYLYFLDPNKIIMAFSAETVFSVIYSSFIASLLFYIYKWQKFIK